MLSRRSFIAFTALLSSPLFAQELGAGAPFSHENLIGLMRETARNPFMAAQNRVLAGINAEQYNNIRIKTPLFKGEAHGYSVEPLHQGMFFQTPARLFIVENGISREVNYNASLFENLPAFEGQGAFSGFRITQNNEEIAKFQAGTTFRSKANEQVFGTLARALVLNVAEATGEEFPSFRSFWIEMPKNANDPLLITGLFDSESITGLARLTTRFGEATTQEVELTFLPRVSLNHIGFAPMTAMYLFGANDKANTDDTRDAVHEVSALNMNTGKDEWILRSIHNPETLQISTFLDNNPKGYGFLQRNRLFEVYQDLDGQFERRPSLWVEPLGEWGEGQVTLLEIPSESQANKNIIAYWHPKKSYPAKQEVIVSYRLHWAWQAPFETQLATVSQARVGKAANKRRRFWVDFKGELNAAAITPVLSNIRGKVFNIAQRALPENKGMRVSFELDPENNISSEIRLVLEQDKKPVSETWLYRWTP